MSMTTHELKTWPVFFQAVVELVKTFEVRKNDRDFLTGDILILREFDPATARYTGRTVRRKVTYMLPGGILGLPDDMWVMSIVPYPVGPA